MESTHYPGNNEPRKGLQISSDNCTQRKGRCIMIALFARLCQKTTFKQRSLFALKTKSSFQILHVCLPALPPGQWHPPLLRLGMLKQLQIFGKGEKKVHLTFSLPSLTSQGHFHAQGTYSGTTVLLCIQYLSFNWFTFLSSQWNLTSEFLKLSLAQEFLPCLWLSQGPQVILPRPVPSWLCSHHVFWYSVTSSCRNIY